MRVSILDIQAPIHLPDVVAVAESAGYHRYWVSEHHTPSQSASPTVAMALAAGVSDRLRVGMGGVLLRMHAPMRVAADVALLRTFFPGRLDVGVAGASAPVAAALTGQRAADDATYRARIEEMVRLITDDKTVACSMFADDAPPQLWLCGSSVSSARMAGELGLRYAYHHQLAPRDADAQAAIGAAYRDGFRPRPETPSPYFAIAAYGAIADTRAAADEAWLTSGGTKPPSFAGTPAEAGEQLVRLAGRYGADEVFIDCFASTLAQRLDGLRGLADALGLATLALTADEITMETAPIA